MFLSGSYKDAWRARDQDLPPWLATYQEITPYFRARYLLDRVRMLRWRRNADTTFADATSLESGRIRHRIAQSICSVILQAASSCFIILYDPTHPRQHRDGDVLKVRSSRFPDTPLSVEIIVCSHHFALTLKSTYQIPLRTPRQQHLSSRAFFTLLRLRHSISCTRTTSTRIHFLRPARRSQSYYHSRNSEL